MTEKINEISTEIKKALEIIDNNEIEIKSFEFNCNQLKKKFHENDITKDSFFGKLFNELKEIEHKPTIYWFEFQKTEFNPNKIFLEFKNYKEQNRERKVPAIYKYPKDTNILYLGKSKQCLWGRLILHLGFHIDKHSQGLLLNEWAEKLNLKLKFNYCSFDSNMSELISFYEYKLAKNTKPLIGKHKL